MKKILLLATLVLGMVSCMKDQSLDANLVGDGNFVLSVALPDDATRAAGTAGTDSAKGAIGNIDLAQYDIRYILEVFDDNDALAKRVENYEDSATSTTFELRLIPGRHYSFVVWADFVKQGTKSELHYHADDLRNIEVIGDQNAMDESRDAYTGIFRTSDNGGQSFSCSSQISFELKRPFAKLRVVTNDIDEIYSSLVGATIEYTADTYQKYDALTKQSSELERVTKTVDFTSDAYLYGGEPTDDGVQTLFADYILGTQNGTVQFIMTVEDSVQELPAVNFNTAIPVQTNYLTTIYGPILTDFNKVTVDINNVFDGEYENNVGAESKSVEESLKKNSEVISIDLTDDVALNGNGVKWGGEDTKLIIIDGQNVATRAAAENYTLTFNTTYRLHIETVNPDAKVILRNLNVTTNKESGTWDLYDIQFNCDVDIENVNFQKAVAFVKAGQTATMKNVTISESHDYYAMWITAEGQTVDIEGLTINSLGRGIKIDEEYVKTPARVTLNVKNAKFTTAKKAAIMVKSAAGADITLSNIDITGVAADSSNEVWIDEDAANTINKVNVIGGSMIVEGQQTVAITDMETLKSELAKAGQAGAGYTVLEISSDIDMTGAAWTPIKVDGYNGADIVTIDGKGHTIKGLTSSLFAGGFAGGSGIVIKNLTIADSKMVADNTQGYGAFVNCADSMDVITLVNCHLKNSSIITPNNGANESRIGGLVGWTAGYNNQNDGPVDSYITIENCSVVGCTLKGAGSIGAICGHAGANAATFTTIKNCTITNNKLISTDDGGWRTGVVVGTANNGQCVISNITERGNTLTQTSASDFKNPTGATRHYYGRFVPAGTGNLTIEGVEITAGITVIADGVFKKDAEKAYFINNAAGLVYMSNNAPEGGVAVKLDADIDLAGVQFNGLNAFNPETNNTFDGQNYTVSNWTYNGGAADMGFIRQWVGPVQNIKFENCHLKTNGRSAVVAAKIYGNIENVSVNNCSIVDSYWACGIIAGLYNAGSVSNCEVKNSSVKSNGGTAAIVGVFNESARARGLTNCSVSNTTINNTGVYGEAYSGGALVGIFNVNATFTFEGCTVSNNTLEGGYVYEKYPADESVTIIDK